MGITCGFQLDEGHEHSLQEACLGSWQRSWRMHAGLSGLADQGCFPAWRSTTGNVDLDSSARGPLLTGRAAADHLSGSQAWHIRTCEGQHVFRLHRESFTQPTGKEKPSQQMNGAEQSILHNIDNSGRL